jgi:hypothetical protein
LCEVAGKIDPSLSYLAIPISGQAECRDAMGASVLPPVKEFEHLGCCARKLKASEKYISQSNGLSLLLPENSVAGKFFIARPPYVVTLGP